MMVYGVAVVIYVAMASTFGQYHQFGMPNYRRIYTNFGDRQFLQKHSFKRSLDIEQQNNLNANEVAGWNNDMNVLKILAGHTVEGNVHRMVKRSENSNGVDNPRRQRQQSQDAYYYQSPSASQTLQSSASVKNIQQIQPAQSDYSYPAPSEHHSHQQQPQPTIAQFSQQQQHSQTENQPIAAQSNQQPQISRQHQHVQSPAPQNQRAPAFQQPQFYHQPSETSHQQQLYAAPAPATAPQPQPQPQPTQHVQPQPQPQHSHQHYGAAPQHYNTAAQQPTGYQHAPSAIPQPQISHQQHHQVIASTQTDHQHAQVFQAPISHQQFNTVPQIQHTQMAHHHQHSQQPIIPPQPQTTQQFHHLAAPQTQTVQHQSSGATQSNAFHHHAQQANPQPHHSHQQTSPSLGTSNVLQNQQQSHHNHGTGSTQPAASQQGYSYESFQRNVNPFTNANTYANINYYQPKALSNNINEARTELKLPSLAEPIRDLKDEIPQPSTSSQYLIPKVDNFITTLMRKDNEYLPPLPAGPPVNNLPPAPIFTPVPSISLPSPIFSGLSENIAPANPIVREQSAPISAIPHTQSHSISSAPAISLSPPPQPPLPPPPPPPPQSTEAAAAPLTAPLQNIETNVKYLRIIQAVPGQPDQVTTLKIEQTISKTGHQTVQIFNMTPEEVAAIKDSDAASIDVSALRTTGTAPAQFYHQLAQPLSADISPKPAGLITSWTQSNNGPVATKPALVPSTQHYHETTVQQSHEIKHVNHLQNHQPYQSAPPSPQPTQHIANHAGYTHPVPVIQVAAHQPIQHVPQPLPIPQQIPQIPQIPQIQQIQQIQHIQQPQTQSHIQHTHHTQYTPLEEPKVQLHPPHVHLPASNEAPPHHQQHHQQHHDHQVQSAPSVETIQILQESSRAPQQTGYPLASELRPTQAASVEPAPESSSLVHQEQQRPSPTIAQPVETVDNFNGYSYRPYGQRRY